MHFSLSSRLFIRISLNVFTSVHLHIHSLNRSFIPVPNQTPPRRAPTHEAWP